MGYIVETWAWYSLYLSDESRAQDTDGDPEAVSGEGAPSTSPESLSGRTSVATGLFSFHFFYFFFFPAELYKPRIPRPSPGAGPHILKTQILLYSGFIN